MKTLPYVMVRWMDTQAGPGWKDREAAEKWANSEGEEHLSLGFRLPIGKPKNVVLAQSIQLAPGGSVGELLEIPAACVVSVRILGRVDNP